MTLKLIRNTCSYFYRKRKGKKGRKKKERKKKGEKNSAE